MILPPMSHFRAARSVVWPRCDGMRLRFMVARPRISAISQRNGATAPRRASLLSRPANTPRTSLQRGAEYMAMTRHDSHAGAAPACRARA